MNNICDTALSECASGGYDDFNRLSALTQTSNFGASIGSFSFTYDRWGNRLTETASAEGTMPSYSVSGTTNQIQNTGFTYDVAGNIISDSIHSYTYDAEGNLLTVDGGSTARYVYDALNRRVSVQTGAGTNETIFDAQNRRVSTWQASNNFGIMGRIYSDTAQIAFRGLSGQTYFEHKNYLGTTRLRTNYQGAIAATETSGPFGEDFKQTVSIVGSDQDPDQFAGLDHDTESGTEHAQFRQLSSIQGRWISPDPYDGSYDLSNPESLNRYSYALNSPLALTDLTGLDPICFQTVYSYFTYVPTTNDDGSQGDGYYELGYSSSFGNVTCPNNGSPSGQNTSLTGNSAGSNNNASGGGGAPSKPVAPNNPCQYAGSALTPKQYANLGKLAGIGWQLGSLPGLETLGVGALGLTAQFSESGALNAQPYSSGNEAQAAAYGNYVSGAYFAGAGQSLSRTLTLAVVYGAKQRLLNGAYSGVSSADMFLGILPKANLQNIINGYTAQMNGTLCHP